jgi:hydroxypyruvate isomerase
MMAGFTLAACAEMIFTELPTTERVGASTILDSR